MSKKAQGLSFNFIVVIAISVIVMLIVIGIFAGRSSEGSRDLQSCEARGGVCGEDHPEATSTEIHGANCYENGEITGETCYLRDHEDSVD